MGMRARWIGVSCVVAGISCGSTLPSDVPGYESRCARMNATPIPAYEGDPHRGSKNVYACDVPIDQLRSNERPFGDGVLIVKESTRADETFVWLIATARKRGGVWEWDEYTRNFSNEEFRHILAGESVCTGCHARAQTRDWIFTPYAAP